MGRRNENLELTTTGLARGRAAWKRAAGCSERRQRFRAVVAVDGGADYRRSSPGRSRCSRPRWRRPWPPVETGGGETFPSAGGVGGSGGRRCGHCLRQAADFSGTGGAAGVRFDH
ncbi:hypothetical protein KSP40_PGU020632 [Platanthera guangdongensis]|uniref:Uncharacterized protein n=1 Tax=Platanthera guangdongensis TaxID=2320717 RepID=A0ABR2LWK3_9ASPA